MEPVIIRGNIGDTPPVARLYYGQPCLETLRSLPAESVDCAVTSPPYWALRNYGVDGQIGLEGTPEAYAQSLVEVFREVRRMLRPDGLLWLNLGDSFFGGGSTTEFGQDPRNFAAKSTLESRHSPGSWNRPVKPREHAVLKEKDLCGIPWRTALALQEDGWHLLNAIVWAKPAHLPNPVKDRLVASHEMIFLLGKSERDVPLEFGDVWWIATVPYPGVTSQFPPTLPERCIRASLSRRGTVLDPFSGSGTTGDVAMRLGHDYIGTDLNVKYLPLAECRLRGAGSPSEATLNTEIDVMDLFSEEP